MPDSTATAGATAEATPAAARDRPEAYLPRDRSRALAAGLELPDRVRGAALSPTSRGSPG